MTTKFAMPVYVQEMLTSVSDGDFGDSNGGGLFLPDIFDVAWMMYLETFVEPIWTGKTKGLGGEEVELIHEFLVSNPSVDEGLRSFPRFAEWMQMFMIDSPKEKMDQRFRRMFIVLESVSLIVEKAHDFYEGLVRMNASHAKSWLLEQLASHRLATAEERISTMVLWEKEDDEKLVFDRSSLIALRFAYVQRDPWDEWETWDFSAPHEKFASATQGLMRGVLSRNLIAAGGAPLACITGKFMRDVDVFLVGFKSVQDAVAAIKDAVNKISRNSQGWTVIGITPNTLSVYVPELNVEVQFVLRMFEDHAQVPLSFDLAPTRVTYDGLAFRLSKTAFNSIHGCIFTTDPLRGTTSDRMAKYRGKGFNAVLVTRDDAQLEAFERMAKKISVLRTEMLIEENAETRVDAILRREARFARRDCHTNQDKMREDGTLIPHQKCHANNDSFSSDGYSSVMSFLITILDEGRPSLPSNVLCARMLRELDDGGIIGDDLIAEVSKALEKTMADPAKRLMDPVRYA